MCKKHGKSEAEYTSHFMRESRDENSRPLCPILLDMKCNRCGAAGHIAARCPDKVCVFCNKNGHTVSYCTNAPKDVIDAFLEKRSNDYEDRKFRGKNDFNNRREERPAFRGDEQPMFRREERPTFRGDEQPMFRREERPTFRSNEQPMSRPVFRREEKPVVVREELPVKKEDFEDMFPSLGGKSKPVSSSVATMNFISIAKAAVDLPEPKVVVVDKKIVVNKVVNKVVNYDYDEETDEDIDVEEYRQQMIDNLIEKHQNSKNVNEPWETVYSKINRIVDKRVLEYEEYLSMKNRTVTDDDW
jgi:hypothetical protein